MSISQKPNFDILAPQSREEAFRGLGVEAPGGMGAVEIAPQSIDLWGIVQRRKELLILFALIGLGLGYLVYSRTPPTYSSSLRLMIWNQSPPMMVNGDQILQGVSINKHLSLITSDLVFRTAIEKGEITKLATLSNSPYPAGVLKGMIRARSLDDNADSIDLSATGANAEDLPKILNQVVSAYEDNVARDSADIGKESVAVLERMKNAIEDEKKSSESQYNALLKKLGLSEAISSEMFRNPFSEKVAALKTSRDSKQAALDEILDKIKLAGQIIKSGASTEEQRKLLVVEARRYLDLPRRDFSTGELTDRKGAALPSEVQSEIERMTRQIQTLNDRIFERELEKSRLSKTYGEKFPPMLAIVEDISSFNKQVLNLTDAIDRMKKDAIEKMEKEIAGEADNPTPASVADQQDESKVLRLYSTALMRDKARLEASLKTVSDQFKDADEQASLIQSEITELNILKSQIEEKRLSIRELLDRLSQLNVLSTNYNYVKVRVIDPPGNGYKVSPKLMEHLGIGAFLATLLGFGLAFLVDRSDLSFRNPHEIFARVRAPVLGRIPFIKGAKAHAKFRNTSLITLHKSGSIASEAFRHIRTAIAFTSAQLDAKVFLMTSPSPGDGKSTTAANIAVSLAQMGKKVVLIDADFRRPRVHYFFQKPISPGISEYLSGKETLETTLVQAADDLSLSIMSAGAAVSNPAELVNSTAFIDLIAELRTRFDYVLIDSPPVLAVSDSVAMSRFVDGVLLVLRIRRGVVVASQKARDQLDMVNARVLGIVVNGLDNNPYYSDYGRYGYGYNSQDHNYGRYGRYYDNQSSVYYKDDGR